MGESDWLAERFEENRAHLMGVAYRMLGSLSEAEDAVQEAWLRLARANTGEVQNLGGWLTTVVARVCLDTLRSRKARREDPYESARPGPDAGAAAGPDPEQEALLAESVGLALLVVLSALAPAERIAFVLHDMFDLPFEEIAPIVGRTPTAARQLASRARRRVRGLPDSQEPDTTRQREVVRAFLAASHGGDFTALLSLLDPNVRFHGDRVRGATGPAPEVRGASAVARLFSGRAQGARAALVDGRPGVVVAPLGLLFLVLRLTITDGRITDIEVVAEPDRLRLLKLSTPEA